MGEIEPESHDIITIFFSDIDAFTTIAKSLPQLKVANLLYWLYLKFDALARKLLC
jgi:class 3 adenylate cyclase